MSMTDMQVCGHNQSVVYGIGYHSLVNVKLSVTDSAFLTNKLGGLRSPRGGAILCISGGSVNIEI